MIKRRTVLLYNLGLVLTLVVGGLLTTYALQLLAQPPGTQTARANSQAKSAKEILEDEDVAHLRATASYYLRLSQDLKRARSTDNVDALEQIRYGCFLLAATFAVGALLGFAAAGPGQKPARVAPQVTTGTTS